MYQHVEHWMVFAWYETFVTGLFLDHVQNAEKRSKVYKLILPPLKKNLKKWEKKKKKKKKKKKMAKMALNHSPDYQASFRSNGFSLQV